MRENFLIGLMIGGFLSVRVGAGPSEASQQLPSGIALHEGLVYSKLDAELKMDLFLPQGASEPVPCVLVIEGGGFMARGGKRVRPFAVYLAENGFAAAAIAYRGRPDHTYRDTIADTKAAIRYIRAISNRYNIDPTRIGATGRSAGGTLAGLLAVTGGLKEFEGEGGHPEFSSRIQAAVGYAGVYDFVGRFTDERQIALQPQMAAKIESNGEWIGKPFSATNEHWLNASAVNHIDKADPPMLLVHCKDDSVVPWIQSQDMYARMTEVGMQAEIECYDTGGHGFRTENPESPNARMVTFFRKVLAAQPAGDKTETGEGSAKLGLSELAVKVRPGFLLGTHVSYSIQRDWDDLPKARKILAGEFNALSVGIYQKQIQRTSQNDWYFDRIDRTIAFAESNNLQVYAHPLFGSNGYIPDWFLKGKMTDEQLLRVVEDRIKTLLTRYRGKIHIIDVYNEGLNRMTGEWRPEDQNFLNRLGMRNTKHGTWPIILEKSFIWCRKYGGDDIKLIYNDNFNAHFGMGQSEGSITLFKGLRAAGIPIDGIGVQTHTGINAKGEHRLGESARGPIFDAGLFARNLRAMGDAGAEVYITECDIHLHIEADETIGQKQAEAYRAMLKACIEEPACKMFKTWGFLDSHGWKPNRDSPLEPRALLFDFDNNPKPAYHAMRRLLLEMLERKQQRNPLARMLF